jgi:hypothetical protein
MKTQTILTSLFLLFLNINAGAAVNTYKSKITGPWYIQISVNMQGSVAKIIREPIAGDASVQQAVYNTTSVPWSGGKMTFPDSGIFWYVPFNADPPFMIIHETCTECTGAYVCSVGSCSWVSSGGGCEVCDCGSSTSNPCQVTQSPCIGSGGGMGGARLIGPGVIIQASSIQLEQVFYSRLIDVNKFCKVTLQYDGSVAHFSYELVDKEIVPIIIGQVIYNYTTIPWKSNVLDIPAKGTFWFIAFDGGEPTELQNGGGWCYDCQNNAACSDHSSCDFRASGNGASTCKCSDGGTTTCTVQRCKCAGQGGIGNNLVVQGGGIILKADEVTF